MKTLPFLSIAALTLPSWLACTGTSLRPTTPVPIASGAAVCEADRTFCEKSCATCTDKAACFENGGECQAAEFFQDTDDNGNDIWTPGCHYRFGDAACTAPGVFLTSDSCLENNPQRIIELTNNVCHPAQGDSTVYDCDAECLRAGRGHGRCTAVPTACAGRGSAHCTCDFPVPPTP